MFLFTIVATSGYNMDDSCNPLADYFVDEDELHVNQYLDVDDSEEFTYRPIWLDSFGVRDLQKAADKRIVNLIESEMPQDIQSWHFTNEELWLFKYPEVEIRIKPNSASYTFIQPPTVISFQKRISLVASDTLRLSMKAIVQNQGPQISSLEDVVILILKLLEETTSQLAVLRRRPYRKLDRKLRTWDPREVKSFADIELNPWGVDFNCIEDTAFHVLKKTPQQICDDFPPQFRILHVQSILRSDLTQRFFKHQADLRSRLERRPLNELLMSVPHKFRARPGPRELSDTLDYLTEPQVTFHGTEAHIISSIVTYGFTIPGNEIGQTGDFVHVRCGNTFGQGIYISPDPTYSMTYDPGGVVKTRTDEGETQRLLICATTMGRRRRVFRSDNRRLQKKPVPGYDSHMAVEDLEYIVFKSEAVLPCYVVHFDSYDDELSLFLGSTPADLSNWEKWMQANSRVKKTHPKLLRKSTFAGDIVREKERKRAAAMKWLPFGFGAATGTSFIVEEIGEVSEDEEKYGEFFSAQDAEIVALADRSEAKQAAHARHLEINKGKKSLFEEYYEAQKMIPITKDPDDDDWY